MEYFLQEKLTWKPNVHKVGGPAAFLIVRHRNTEASLNPLQISLQLWLSEGLEQDTLGLQGTQFKKPSGGS